MEINAKRGFLLTVLLIQLLVKELNSPKSGSFSVKMMVEEAAKCTNKILFAESFHMCLQTELSITGLIKT